MKRRIGILTSGGDCPGLNAAIRGVTRAAYELFDAEIVGIHDGYRGLITGDYQEMKRSQFSGILTLGGTILGTARTPFRDMRKIGEDNVDKVAAMKKTYKDLKLDCLVTLGGNGTHKTANLLSKEGLNVIGLPKTIDNDLYGTDFTFGFHTAMDIATEVIDRIHTTAASHGRCMVVEIMGNKAGWLTLYSGVAGGADATKQAAQLTLLDANFANMPLIVAEGRRVVGNITRAASLFLVKTLYSFALALLTLLFPVEYPFQPIQLTLISSLTIGLPAFLLTLEPNQDRIQGSFLRTVLTRAIPGAAAVCVCAMAAMAGVNFGWDMADCKTLAALCAGAVGLMMLYSVSVPLTKLRAAVCTVMTAGFVLAVCYFKQIFYFEHLTLAQYGALAGLIALAALVMAAVSWAAKRLPEKKG